MSTHCGFSANVKDAFECINIVNSRDPPKPDLNIQIQLYVTEESEE